MLDITKLNTKLTQLHDQDITFIDQIYDLYMRANESTRKIELLDAMITDQRDVMDVQARKIRELTTETHDTKEYRVVWQSGHTQTMDAHSTGDAYTKTLTEFTGSDIILYVETSVNDMVLTMRPYHYNSMKLDEIELLDDDTVVGCGLKEGDFDKCLNCHGKNDPDECRSIRRELGLSKTTAKELSGNDQKVYNT